MDGLVLIEMPEGPVNHLFLVEGELRLRLGDAIEAEHQLHEGDDEHIGSQAAQDMQQVEEHVEGDLGREMAQIGQYAVHGFHCNRIWFCTYAVPPR